MAPTRKSTAKNTVKPKPAAKAAAKATPAPKTATTAKPTAAKSAVVIAAAAAPVAVNTPPPPMVLPELPSEPIDINDKKAVEAYQNLYDQLGELRWKLTDPDAIDHIKEVRDVVYDVLTKMNKAQIADNTAAYAALQPDIDDCNKQLSVLRKDIGTIVTNIAIAGTVASAISRVLGIVTTL